jgi:GAF domain-containing protein
MEYPMYPGELLDLCSEILTEGNVRLSMTMGIVSHIEDEKYEIVSVKSLTNVFVAGESFQLQDTYCRDVYRTGETIALTEMGGQPGLQSHPLYSFLPLEAYISAPILFNGEIWGTLNFSSMIVKPETFSDSEVDFVNSSAMLISLALSEIDS